MELVPQLEESRGQIVDAIHYPNDGSCDGHAFCTALAKSFVELGGVIDNGVAVEQLVLESGRVTGVKTAEGQLPASQVIVATGNQAASLLNPLSKALGRRYSLRPVKGYSLTFDTEGTVDIPQMPIIDDALHIAVTPIGNKLRIAGFAEFTGHDTTPYPKRIKRLEEQLAQLFPSIAQQVKSVEQSPWACLRPMTPDGRPIIGPTAVPGLAVNLGHGHLGLSKAVGSGMLCADLLEGKPTAIDANPFLAT